MPPEAYAAIAIGLLELTEKTLDQLSRYRGEVSEETQRQVAAKVEAIRTKEAFKGDHWRVE